MRFGQGWWYWRGPAPEPEPRRATVYLMLARHDDGQVLGLTFATEKSLAVYGRFCWELVDRPYATTTAATYEQAEAAMLAAIATDPEPWPDEMVPHVEALVSASPHGIGSNETGDERPSLIDAIRTAVGGDMSGWSTAKLHRVAAAIRRAV